MSILSIFKSSAPPVDKSGFLKGRRPFHALEGGQFDILNNGSILLREAVGQIIQHPDTSATHIYRGRNEALFCTFYVADPDCLSHGHLYKIERNKVIFRGRIDQTKVKEHLVHDMAEYQLGGAEILVEPRCAVWLPKDCPKFN